MGLLYSEALGRMILFANIYETSSWLYDFSTSVGSGTDGDVVAKVDVMLRWRYSHGTAEIIEYLRIVAQYCLVVCFNRITEVVY